MFETPGFSGLLLLNGSHASGQLVHHISDHTGSSQFLLLTKKELLAPHVTQVPGSQAPAGLRAAASDISAPDPQEMLMLCRWQTRVCDGASAAPCHCLSWQLEPWRKRDLCQSTRLQAEAAEVVLSTPHSTHSKKHEDNQGRRCNPGKTLLLNPQIPSFQTRTSQSHYLFSGRIQPEIKTVLLHELRLSFICPQMYYTDITQHHCYLYHSNSNNFHQDPWPQLVSSTSLEMFDVGSLNGFE